MLLQLTVVIIFVVESSTLCCAQVQCSGDIMGTVNNNVECAGNCVLNGATVNGNVQCSTGTLLIKGGSTVTGGVTVDGSVTSAEIDDATLLGGLLVTDASSLVQLVIKQAATLDSVTVTNTPGDVIAAGQLTDLKLSNSGDLVADNLVTTGSVSVTGGTGVIDVCSSTLGGLSVLEHTGDIEIDANKANCGPSSISIDAGFIATKGTGSVTLRGATLSSGDFTVLEYSNGDVLLQGTQVGDILLSQNTGGLTLKDLTADSDTTIITQEGNMEANNLTTLGDFGVNSVNGNMVLTNSKFTLEDISISLVTGSVTVQGNMDLSLVVSESGGQVTITGNTATNVGVNKNTGGVTFTGNTFISLSCSDNSPAPTGSGNNVDFPDGQCATGFP